MTDGARQEILARIRSANSAAEAGTVRTHPIPARAQGTESELRGRFIDMAREAAATIDHVASLDTLSKAVRSFLDQESLPKSITLGRNSALRSIAWESDFDTGDDPMGANNKVAITPAFAGIAETGTLLVHSGPRNPNQLHFLPETHIAVLWTKAIVGSYEDAWNRIVKRFKTLPRSVTLITGPSRSSDIERQLQIGVHGPHRLHIVLYDGQER